jgi:hypothetical protein
VNNEKNPIQDEDRLIETILNGNDDAVGSLLQKEPGCAQFVHDILSVKEGLQLIEEEPAPAIDIEKIIRKNNRPPFSRLQDLPLEWFKNPYILSFGFIMAVICIYFLIIFIGDL